MRETRRAEKQKKVHLRDAEFDMLPLIGEAPFLRGRDPFIAERIGKLIAGEQAAPIDPRAEIGRDRYIGRGGDQPVGKDVFGLGQFIQNLPETGLGGLFPIIGHRQGRHVDGACRIAARSFGKE